MAGASVGVALALGACNPSTQPASPAPAAPTLSDEDLALNARIIELKNKIQRDGFDANAHFGLGQALIEQARLADADAEISRALELGLDRNIGLPLLAHVWNLRERAKDLIEAHAKTQLSSPEASADLKAELSLAYASTGDPKQARALVESALRDDPRSARARVLQAQIAMADGKADEALRLLADTLALHPKAAEAWITQGDILLTAKGDRPAAARAFEQALLAQPRHLPTHSRLINLALDTGDLTLAQSRLQALTQIAPTAMSTLYYSARVAQAGGDLVSARQHVQGALASHPTDVRSLLLAAEIDLAGNALTSAEQHLSSALIQAPANTRTRQLLAQTYLRLGSPQEAQSVLDPIVRSPRADARSLGLAAEAAMQLGLTVAATGLYERAAAADPSDTRARTALAVIRIGKGQADSGFAELEAIAAADRSTYADMALLTARLRTGNLGAAITAAEGVALKQPRQAQPQWLLGRLKLQDKARDDARRHFERALELDPAFLPAALALATMHLEAKDPVAARRQVQNVLAVNPRQMDALLAMAEVRAAAGEPRDNVTAALTQVVSMYPAHPAPVQALVQHLVRSGETSQALLAAQRAAEAMPADLDIIELLGRTQLAAGESAQALSTLRRLVTARPRSPEPHLEMADVYLQRKEIDSAIESVRRAVLLQPQSLSAQTKLAGLLTSNKQWRDAMVVVRDVQRLQPSQARGWHLEGLVHAAQGHWEPAVAAFQRAMKLGESAELAVQTYDALRGAGRKGEADALAASWIARHPKDQSFVGHLADLALVQGDHATAARHYRSILKTDEGNAGALNNLAWALMQMGDPDALVQARKAAALQPGNAAVLDTLSLALARAGQIDDAIANQRKALALAPDAHALRLHLAQFAVKRGDYAVARAELDKLSALGAGFSGQGEVWQLRQQLR